MSSLPRRARLRIPVLGYSREAAIGVVEKLALSDPNRVMLMNHGAVEKLVELLWGRSGRDAQRAATRALINLAANDLCKERIALVRPRPLLKDC